MPLWAPARLTGETIACQRMNAVGEASPGVRRGQGAAHQKLSCKHGLRNSGCTSFDFIVPPVRRRLKDRVQR